MPTPRKPLVGLMCGTVLLLCIRTASLAIPGRRSQEAPPPAQSAPAQAEPVQAEPVQSAPAHPQTGPELFQSAGCSHCHTIDGVGGDRGPDLSGIGRRWKDDQIRQRIAAGTLEMPPFADILSSDQVSTLVAYLHTRRAREPKLKARQKAPAASAQPVQAPS